MKYFGIFGNICSIFGFIVAMFMLITTDTSNTYLWVIFGFIVVTIVFWIYFYMKPQNSLARTINAKLDYAGEYIDSKDRNQSVVEGKFVVDTNNWGTSVSLPPFEKPPKISIVGTHTRVVPTILEVTEDYFLVQISSSSQSGTWKWRARGKLLNKVKNV